MDNTIPGTVLRDNLGARLIIPQQGRTGEVITRIESIIEEGFVEPLLREPPQPLSIPFCRSTATGEFERTTVTYPAEARKFSQILRLLQRSHAALREGKILTKRNLYYEEPELYGSQARVDELVDGLAWTLGVQRHDLSIAAAGKGLLAGPVRLHLHSSNADVVDLSQNSEGVLVPHHLAISRMDFGNVCWVLVVEKEATFRTLAASKYWESGAAGPCLLVTGKGYPDLMTRRFLHLVHQSHETMPMYVLTDFDPDGISIFRCYKWESKSAAQREDNIRLPRLRWLGIRSDDIVLPRPEAQSSQSTQDHGSQGSTSSQTSITSISSSVSYQGLITLSDRDRKLAVKLLKGFHDLNPDQPDVSEVIQELQVLLMLNLKAEIQILNDGGGDVGRYLDRKLGADFS